MTMRYSIVIPTYNRASDLEQTLGSLAELVPSAPWEVVVVDNNSPDGTRRVTRFNSSKLGLGPTGSARPVPQSPLRVRNSPWVRQRRATWC